MNFISFQECVILLVFLKTIYSICPWLWNVYSKQFAIFLNKVRKAFEFNKIENRFDFIAPVIKMIDTVCCYYCLFWIDWSRGLDPLSGGQQIFFFPQISLLSTRFTRELRVSLHYFNIYVSINVKRKLICKITDFKSVTRRFQCASKSGFNQKMFFIFQDLNSSKNSIGTSKNVCALIEIAVNSDVESPFFSVHSINYHSFRTWI